MKRRTKLNKDKCEYIRTAIEFYIRRNLKPAIKILREAKYQPSQYFVAGEDFFKQYINEQLNILDNQVEEFESIYDEIFEMEENQYAN